MNKEITLNLTTKEAWNLLFDHENYKIWAKAFHEGSYYEGELALGSKIIFGDENMQCLESEVVEFDLYKKIVFGKFKDLTEYNMEFKDEDTEGYEFIEVDENTTKLVISLADIEFESFYKMWDEAIKNIEELALNYKRI